MRSFALGAPSEVSTRWAEVEAALTERFPGAAGLMLDSKTDVLTFTAFPRAHWRKIWSNNPLERLDKEVERRSNVVGRCPSGGLPASHHKPYVLADECGVYDNTLRFPDWSDCIASTSHRSETGSSCPPCLGGVDGRRAGRWI